MTKHLLSLTAQNWQYKTKLTLDGLKGPAKALTAITGSFGLLGNLGERFSIGSGDQGVPITGWEELSVALNKGMYNRSVAHQISGVRLWFVTNLHFLNVLIQKYISLAYLLNIHLSSVWPPEFYPFLSFFHKWPKLGEYNGWLIRFDKFLSMKANVSGLLYLWGFLVVLVLAVLVNVWMRTEYVYHLWTAKFTRKVERRLKPLWNTGYSIKLAY